jgi:hypothetical protein
MNQMQNIAGCRGCRNRVADHAYSDNHVPDAGNRAPSPGVRTAIIEGGPTMDFTRGALLWLLGVPLPIILLIALFWHP